MEKKLLTNHYYAGTIYGDKLYDELMEMLTRAKRDVELICPEVLTNGNPIRVEFDYDEEYGNTDVNIIYYRHETDAEYEARTKTDLEAKRAAARDLHRKIDANKEEVIAYLKSIGAI